MSPQPNWRDRLLASWWRRRWRGFLTLRQLLGRGAGVRAVTPYGSTFLLDPLSYIDGIVLSHGFYESEVLEALRAACSAGTRFDWRELMGDGPSQIFTRRKSRP